MMPVAQQRLHQLWWQPGAVMAPGWWHAVALQEWQPRYAEHATLRPALDQLITQRLGQLGALPPLTPAAQNLLYQLARTQALCAALGLWLLGCPDYLLLRPYRQALARVLSEEALTQLQMLLPAAAANPPAATVEPAALAELALGQGAAWLASAGDPAVALARLLWPPQPSVTSWLTPVMPVLEKLQKWM